MSRYRTARERLTIETRREIASHAARARQRQRAMHAVICECGDPEDVHWSVGKRDCRACDLRENLEGCQGFTPRAARIDS